MDGNGNEGARLVTAEGKVMPLEGEDFKIGRSSGCGIIVDDDQVSREHCLFHHDRDGTSWSILDLNSRNGTYVSDRRITAPTLLRHGDSIQVGPLRLKFESADGSGAGKEDETNIKSTMVKSEAATCWLLLLDVVGSTRMTQKIKPEELSGMIRAWANDCEAFIEEHSGMVNEYLGDGLFAFWKSEWAEPTVIATALRALEKYRRESALDFRAILHLGSIRVGDGISSGKERLFGQELHFVFKAEKAVGKDHSNAFVVSEAAADGLRDAVKLEMQGEVQVPGFSEPRAFFVFKGVA